MATVLTFNVRRQEPVWVRPALPTPREFKRLSDIDDQGSLRYQSPCILFYPKNNDLVMGGRDPARVVMEGLSKALVFYYPFAGRLREGANGKLMVECTGEGVVFVEADADVRLEQFGDQLGPPFPLKELLSGVEEYSDILDCPLLFLRVNRLGCGGFIVAFQYNGTMADGFGMIQFMKAVGELARRYEGPTVRPLWQRHLLDVRSHPKPTYVHREYENVVGIQDNIDEVVHRSFFLGPNEITALRRHLPPHLQQSTRFEVLTASLWKSRTVALQLSPDEEVCIICAVNLRKFKSLLPDGYYGNAIALPTAASTADKLCSSPLEYALSLVKKAKSYATEDYIKSVADLMVLKGRPEHTTVQSSYMVSDLTGLGFHKVNFGWGEAAFGGPAICEISFSCYIPFKDGIIVPICLSGPVMDRFAAEIESMTNKSATILSAL